ncbi:EF-hand domain-containing protein [Steroidobacter sp.]|uniref:EF-hand domain-containing protein n=1 Tax=Steroidobacter sp. TaxID=1978227 RepID=UPI001A506D6B|nr:EF-hand domain-containing protein [Steroidobacter sp.]MBL8270670.1 EF-hand domain-containing protein [Steroidobacter sp.]
MSRTFISAALLLLLSAPLMAQSRGEGALEKADTNKDGSVTREEYIAARAERFTKLDRNSDGVIDSSDVPEQLAARRQKKGGGDFLLEQFDTDGDGKVTREEFVNGPTLLFDRADTDKSNVLDPQELAAAKEAAKAARENWRNRKTQ